MTNQTHGSLNNLLAGSSAAVPLVGMGATECLWTDRRAYTIIAISASGKTLTLRADKATRTDSNGMSECQNYTHTEDLDGETVVVRRTKKGWSSKSRKFVIGHRDTYHDYSF